MNSTQNGIFVKLPLLFVISVLITACIFCLIIFDENKKNIFVCFVWMVFCSERLFQGSENNNAWFVDTVCSSANTINIM